MDMDWFTLTTEVLARKRRDEEVRDEEEEESASTTDTEEIFEEIEKVEEKLHPLEAAAMSCILQTASLQLSIIDMAAWSTSPNYSHSVARKKVIDVIKETEKEIRTKGTLDVLYEKTKQEGESRRAAKLLEKSVAHNQFRIANLKSKLKEHVHTKMKETNKQQEIIASLKDKIHEEIIKSDVKLRYTERWEAARQCQNRMRCQNAESELEKKLEEVTNKHNNEIRVHDEMCNFLALEEKALAGEVDKWKEAYRKEMKKRTEKIKMLEKKRTEQQILHRTLSQLYQERQREINEYLSFKEKIHKEQERERYINDMATKIQAWWRGTMVRRGFGPFKKKKKPAKEKKKK